VCEEGVFYYCLGIINHLISYCFVVHNIISDGGVFMLMINIPLKRSKSLGIKVMLFVLFFV
jgi:hypothetical protein